MQYSNNSAVAGVSGNVNLDVLNPSVSLSSLNSAIPATAASELSSGLQALPAALAGLATTPRIPTGSQSSTSTVAPFSQPLPLIGLIQMPDGTTSQDAASSEVTLGGALNLAGVFQTSLFQPVNDYFASTTTPTTDGLLQYLAQHPISGIGTITPYLSSDEISFHAVLHLHPQPVSENINLGSSAAALGLNLPATQSVNIQPDLNFDFSFGIDLANGLTAAQAFFLDVHSLTATLDATWSGSFKLDIGLFDASVNGASVVFHAGVSAVDPDGSQNPIPRMTLDQLQRLPLGQLIGLSTASSVTGANSPTGVLPVEVKVGNTIDLGNPSGPSGAVANIDVSSNDLFSGDVTCSFDNVSRTDGIDKLANLTPQGVLEIMQQIGGWLGNVQTSSIFSQNLPFTSGESLGSAMNLSAAWSAGITSMLQGSGGSLSFTDAQGLLQQLSNSVDPNDGMNYDPATGDLLLNVDLKSVLAQQSASLNLGASLGSLANLSTSSTIDFQATVDTAFTLGINLSPVGGGFELDETTPLTQIDGGTASAPRAFPVNPLQADLQISLSDGTSALVSFYGAATIGNVLDRLNSAAPGKLVAQIDGCSRLIRSHYAAFA